MWRVVCVGPGPFDKERRVVDKGPLLVDERHALAIRQWLAGTGLYESVTVETSAGVMTTSNLAKGQ
ncbi:hypothetical protein BH11PSE8_BH11PSE8_43490 [soil metagenome]